MVDLDAPEGKVISPRSLAHVFLRTNNYRAMVDFYKVFLGAESRYESDRVAFISYDEEHHRIAIAAIPGTGTKVKTSAGLEHIAFTFDSLDELALAYRQRKSLGITPVWCVNHGVTTSMYYADPDGNNLETQFDNFDTIEETNAFMDSKAFRENPIGTDFDPEDLVRRLQSGEDRKSIQKRVENGPRGVPDHMKA